MKKKIPEGILDAFMYVLCSVHDLKKKIIQSKVTIYIQT